MPILATSYDGFAELMILLWTWPVAAGLSLLALILVFWRKTRRGARGCAVASMIVSGVVCLPIISLASSERQRSDLTVGWLIIVFLPLIVAIAVYWFAHRSLRGKRDDNFIA